MDNDQFEAYYKEVAQLPPLKETKKARKRDNKKKDRKNGIAVYLSAFLAGALMIGGLACTADRMNLFTGEASNRTAYYSNTESTSFVEAGIVTASQSKTASSTSDVYAATSPSVVKIETYTESQATSMFNDPRMWQYFGEMPRGQNQQDQSTPNQRGDHSETDSQMDDAANLQLSGSGTGFVVDASGYIVTNAHVVADAKQVKVSINGYDEAMTATVIGSSSELDIALLKVDVPNGARLPALTLANSDELAIGQWVLAIGNPLGYDSTLTMGIISATERPITIENSEGMPQVFEHMLQTDASINPGNSGGPLLNEAGQVIGMNTAVNSEAQGMGFAIPANIIAEYLNTLAV